jgi:hypothetical protein
MFTQDPLGLPMFVGAIHESPLQPHPPFCEREAVKKSIWFSIRSFRRKPESSVFNALSFDWTPVFTGVTTEFQFLHTFRRQGGIL